MPAGLGHLEHCVVPPRVQELMGHAGDREGRALFVALKNIIQVSRGVEVVLVDHLPLFLCTLLEGGKLLCALEADNLLDIVPIIKRLHEEDGNVNILDQFLGEEALPRLGLVGLSTGGVGNGHVLKGEFCDLLKPLLKDHLVVFVVVGVLENGRICDDSDRHRGERLEMLGPHHGCNC